jgi:LruC domain-containing protein
MSPRLPASILAVLLTQPLSVYANLDADGDGAPDSADTFPCDPTLAGQSFAPAEGAFGQMQFEDQWPSKGDLDFNDVQVAWHYTLEQQADGRVVAVRATYDVLALGGIYTHGLGLHLPVPAGAVASITRQVGGAPPQALSASAADAELTISVVDNLRALFGGQADQINSRGPALRGQGIELIITFATPQALSSGLAPFDLFIFRTQDKTHEIHRPEFGGTAVMNAALFGTADDASSPDRHFVDVDGLPFALALPEVAPYPQEGVAISALFPNILNFARTGGAADADFYVRGVVLAHAYANALSPAFLSVPVTPDRACTIPDCQVNNGGCDPLVTCTNPPGQRVCGACPAGYSGAGDTGCVDVDECLAATANCGVNATCTNTAGSFTCACDAGWEGDGRACVDVDECATDNGGCGEDGICVNSAGSFVCTCGPGFDQVGNRCVDVDECATNHGGCSALAACNNYPGGHACECLPGYLGNGVNCTDLNECTTGQHDCGTNAVCTNLTGTFSCACAGGFTGDGHTCTDVNECANGTAGCSVNAACANTQGGFTCTCAPGYAGNGQSCADLDECALGTHACSPNGACTNAPGGYSCACGAGFTGDGFTCTDIDECSNGVAQCDVNATCQNDPGAYACVCNPGYSGDGQSCTPTNPGSLVLISGNSQTVARQRTTSSTLVVQVLSPTGAAMGGYGVTFQILSGGGSLDAVSTVTTKVATSDGAGYARVSYTAGTTLGAASVRASDGVGHTQTFSVTVRDYTPTSVSVSPLRAGAATLLEFSQVDPQVPGYLAPQTAPVAAISPKALTLAVVAPSASTGSNVTAAPALATQLKGYDNVASAGEPLDLRVTAAFATGSNAASCAVTTDSVPGLAGQACPNLTRTAPTQVLAAQRGDLTPGLVKVKVTASDAAAGPLDSRTAQLTATGVSIRQVSNVYGQYVHTGSVMLAPYGTNQLYLAAANSLGRTKLYQYTVSTNSMQQVADIRGPDYSDGVAAPMVVSGADVYLVSVGEDTFSKLYKYNGVSGTQVSDTRPGNSDGISLVIPFNGGVVFTANDANGFRKLYWTNGGMATQVSDTFPGGSDAITSIRVYNGAVYFNAAIATGVLRLFRWSGTVGSPVLQIDGPRVDRTLTDGVGNLWVYGANLYMTMVNASGATKLFKYNGSTLTSVTAIRSTGSSEAPNPLVVFNSKLYFYASNGTGYKLYSYDDSTGAVAQISDTRPGTSDGVNVTFQSGLYPLHLATSSNRLYFVAQNAQGFNKLWQYNGTSVTQLPDTNPGDHDNPLYLAVHNGNLFYASVNASGVQKLFKWNGTTVTQFADLNPGANDDIRHPRSLNGQLIFWGRNAQNVLKLWKTDGTAAPVPAPDPSTGSALNRGSDSPTLPIVYNNDLYFRGTTALAASKLHKLNGATITQVTSTSLPESDDAINVPVICHGKLYFSAYDALGYIKLWQHDGAATAQITDLNPVGSDAITTPVCYKNVLYFGASMQYSAATVSKLFSYDGTTLRQLTNLRGSGTSDAVAALSVWNNALYFRAYVTNASRTKLYRYDGTSLVQVSNICGTSCSDAISLTVPTPSYLYLTAAPRSDGFIKLFRYDGSTFEQITDFFPAGSDTFSATHFLHFNGKTYFQGTINGLTKLFADDGNSVAQVSDLNPGGLDAPTWMALYNGKMWLSMYNPNNRVKLFRFDGTTFVQVSDLEGPDQHDSPSYLIEYQNALYLRLTNHGVSKLHRLCEASAGCTP